MGRPRAGAGTGRRPTRRRRVGYAMFKRDPLCRRTTPLREKNIGSANLSDRSPRGDIIIVRKPSLTCIVRAVCGVSQHRRRQQRSRQTHPTLHSSTPHFIRTRSTRSPVRIRKFAVTCRAIAERRHTNTSSHGGRARQTERAGRARGDRRRAVLPAAT
ncbi:hypothetical protein EVAR_7203_1 [Eumeta japonica]|uniref:Uncharacterized protein n=1 Tax=Eumeta variegata TaxID=151549 RepID=A0A4C1T551_EUMVA|nr:hypothetical protein EVAR_7203_1 [Eumeta japonica]